VNPSTVPPASTPDPDRARFYADDAAWYASRLRIEDYMESIEQATQRKVTVASFDLIARARPDVQCFNELLIQYPIARQRQPGRVIPDNFVVVHPVPIVAGGSFAVDVQPVGPLLVLEYVSKHNPRKDYEDNFVRYEQALRVPYYLLFYPDNEELTLFRLAAGKYQSVPPNDAGRFAVPELELEVGIEGGWARFWFRGERLPLPAELADRAEAAEQRAAVAEAELARLREELARRPGGG